MSTEEQDEVVSQPSKRQKSVDTIDINTDVSVSNPLNWTLSHAVREVLTNCFDEDLQSEAKFDEQSNTIILSNASSAGGITRDSLAYKASNKRKDPTKSGNFGYGLKDAIVILFSHGIKWKATTQSGTYESLFDREESTSARVLIKHSEFRHETHTIQELSIVHPDDMSLKLRQAKEEWKCMQDRLNELKSALSEAQSQCAHAAEFLFRATQVASMKDTTPIGTMYIFEAASYGTSVLYDGLYVHNVKYRWHRDRRKFLFAYNLYMPKTALLSRDRDRLPPGWDTSVEDCIIYAPSEQESRIMSILDCARRRPDSEHIYELRSTRILAKIDKYLYTCEEKEKICAAENKKLVECDEAVVLAEQEVEELEAQRSAPQSDESEEPLVTEYQIAVATINADVARHKSAAQRTLLVRLGIPEGVKPYRRPVWVNAKDPEYPRAVSDPSVLAHTATNVKHQVVLQNSSYSEYELLQRLDVGVEWYPVIRQTHRVLSALNLMGRFRIERLPPGDFSGMRVVLRHDTLLIAFDHISPNNTNELSIFQRELFIVVSQAPLAELYGKSPVESLAFVAQETLKHFPEQLVCTNQTCVNLGPRIPLAFRPLMITTEWSRGGKRISSYTNQLAHGLAEAGVEVMVAVIGQILESVVSLWPKGEKIGGNGGSIYVFDCSQYRTLWTPALNGRERAVSHVIGFGDVTSNEAAQIAALPLFSHVKLWQFNYQRLYNVPVSILSLNVDFVWSVGQMMFDHFTSYAAASKHARIVLPLNPTFNPSSSPPALAGSSTFRVLFIGRGENQDVKGLDIAVGACAHARNILRKAKCATHDVQLIVRGMTSTEIKQQAKAPERDALAPIFREFGTTEDIQSDLRNCHLFIMPSRSEPFGLVATEAIASARPVLVSANSGVAKLLGEVEMEQDCAEVELVTTSTVTPEIVQKNFKEDVNYWGDAIVKTVQNYERRVARAEKLREAVSKYVEATRPYETFVNQGCTDLGLPLRFVV